MKILTKAEERERALSHSLQETFTKQPALPIDLHTQVVATNRNFCLLCCRQGGNRSVCEVRAGSKTAANKAVAFATGLPLVDGYYQNGSVTWVVAEEWGSGDKTRAEWMDDTYKFDPEWATITSCDPMFQQARAAIYAGKPDPLGVLAKGYRFVVRGDDATWMNPVHYRPGDVDVTDIGDQEELCRIFIRERERVGKV